MADDANPTSGMYPYAQKYGVLRGFPDEGRPRDAILDEMREMAEAEDKRWQNGHCSGTMYCGDMEHYDFIGDAYKYFLHVNALQRDICPSQNRFESEIIAMGLDMLHAGAVTDGTPCGSITSGGTESIITALVTYRDKYRAEKGITKPNIILPKTAHSAFRKGSHLFCIDIIDAPVDPNTTLVDVDFVKNAINENNIALVGSAGNYAYGTIDPIDQLSGLAKQHGLGLHVDGCLGGFILPWGQELGYDNIPVFDFRLPGVTSISADTHKYGYAPKGTSLVLYRDKEIRKYQYFFDADWNGGKYASPGIGGSRSGGLIAATWAAMVSLGREGYLRYAKAIFDTALEMQKAVKSHPEFRMMGTPTWCFAFTSDAIDIYHVNDYMRTKGWRFNGLQYPNAVHMCITRPQTQPGVAAAFAKDLADAVEYAKAHEGETPKSAAIYGGVPEEVPEMKEMVRMVIAQYMDSMTDGPEAA